MSVSVQMGVTLPVPSFTWGLEERLPTWPLTFFHVLLLSPLTHLPTHLCPLLPMGIPRLPYSPPLALSSSSSVFPCIYHFVLLLPTASPCPQHPSRFLLLPPTSLLSAALSPAETPLRIFPPGSPLTSVLGYIYKASYAQRAPWS